MRSFWRKYGSHARGQVRNGQLLVSGVHVHLTGQGRDGNSSLRERCFSGVVQLVCVFLFPHCSPLDTLCLEFTGISPSFFTRVIWHATRYAMSSGVSMTFQNKLFLQLLVIALALVTVFPYCVIRYTKTAFEEIEAQREQAQITQFKQQFARFGDEVVRRVESIANAEATLRMAMDLARPKADKSLYVRDAIGAAQDRNLDVLEIATWDGTIISSTPDYSRVGRNNALVSAKMDWSDSPAFLDKQQLPDGDALLLLAVRPNAVQGKRIYIIGGCRVDQNFLSSFVLPANMRVLLHRNFSESTFEPTGLLDRTGLCDRPKICTAYPAGAQT